MNEIVVKQAPEGGFTAHSLGESIFTEADSEAELRIAIQDAVQCHFDDGKSPRDPLAFCTRRIDGGLIDARPIATLDPILMTALNAAYSRVF